LSDYLHENQTGYIGLVNLITKLRELRIERKRRK